MELIATNLAEMFNVNASTIRHYIQSAGLDIKFHVGHSMNREQRAAWETFLSGSQVSQSVQETAATVLDDEPPRIYVDTPMRMDRFSLSFSGDINVDMIANSLKHILGGNATGQVEIVCNLSQNC